MPAGAALQLFVLSNFMEVFSCDPPRGQLQLSDWKFCEKREEWALLNNLAQSVGGKLLHCKQL